MKRIFLACALALLGSLPSRAAGPNEEIKIALLADPHCTLATEGRKGTYRGHFEEVIQQVNAAGVDLVLIAGDLADSSKPEQWALFQEMIKALSAPVLYVPGNHDVGPKPNTGKEGVTHSKRIEAYEKALGPSFWVKEIAGVRVIGVTGSLWGTGLPEEAAQWELIEKTLAVTSALPTIILSHYPLFEDTVDEPGGGYWNVEPAERERLLALIRSGKVAAVLTGHLHRPLLHRRDGVLYAGAPPISFGLPFGKQAEGWTLVTLPKHGEIEVATRELVPKE